MLKQMVRKIFRGKSEEEKQISKLESQLNKLKQQRDFWSPRAKKRMFGGYEVENIPISRLQKIETLDKEIILLEETINRRKTLQ